MITKSILTLSAGCALMVLYSALCHAQGAAPDEWTRCVAHNKRQGISPENAAAGCQHVANAAARYEDKQYEAAIAEYKRAYELLFAAKLSTIIHDIWAIDLSDRRDYVERALADIAWCEEVWRNAAHPNGPLDELQKLHSYRASLLERQAQPNVVAPPPAPVKAPTQPLAPPAQVPHQLTWWVVSLAGAGVLSAAVGGAFGIDAINTESKMREKCETSAGKMICSPGVDQLESRRSTSATTSDVLFAVGGGLGIAAAIMLYLDVRRGAESKPALAIRSRNGGAEVTLEGRF